MMASLLCNAIYLFDVYLLASLFGSRCLRLAFGEVRRGVPPKNHSPLARDTPSQILCEIPRPHKSFNVRFTPKSDIVRYGAPQGRSESGGRLYKEIEAVLFKDRLRRLRTQE
jgi:hypothetical protein